MKAEELLEKNHNPMLEKYYFTKALTFIAIVVEVVIEPCHWSGECPLSFFGHVKVAKCFKVILWNCKANPKFFFSETLLLCFDIRIYHVRFPLPFSDGWSGPAATNTCKCRTGRRHLFESSAHTRKRVHTRLGCSACFCVRKAADRTQWGKWNWALLGCRFESFVRREMQNSFLASFKAIKIASAIHLVVVIKL